MWRMAFSTRMTRAVLVGCLLGVSLVGALVVGTQTFRGETYLVKANLGERRAFLANVLQRWTGKGMETRIVSPEPPRVLFVGDVMLDRLVADRTRASGNPVYPFARLPDGWFDSFDIAVANLEGPLSDVRLPPHKEIDFAFEPTWGTRLRTLGVDAVSQANNHSLDQGREEADRGMARLREAGLLAFGDQVRDGEVALATTTVRGMTIAFLGFNVTDNPLDREEAARMVTRAKRSADRVMVFLHWGEEYQPLPSVAMRELATWFAAQRVDAIIGAHPHWAQGISRIQGVPVAWSLGNFVFDQDWSDETKEGLGVAVSFFASSTAFELFPVRIEASQPRLHLGTSRLQRLQVLAERSDADLREAVSLGRIVFSRAP